MRGILCTVGVGVALVSAMFCVVFATELVTGSGGKTEPPVVAGLLSSSWGRASLARTYAWRMMQASRHAAAAGSGSRAPADRRQPARTLKPSASAASSSLRRPSTAA